MVNFIELKIKKEFYDLILSGEKKYEIRKLNKNNINVGDIITFINLDDPAKVLGYSIVTFKCLFNLYDFDYIKNLFDEKTIKFIFENYYEEKILIMFKLKNIVID